MPSYVRLSTTGAEPLTLQEVKDYLRVDNILEDNFLTALIVAVRQNLEDVLWSPIVNQTWSMNFDYSELNRRVWNVNKSPIREFTSVTYYDTNNDLQTLSVSDYDADINGSPARINLKTLPVLYDKFNTLQVNFTAGYANAASVPGPIKQAMYMLIGHYNENRQEVITGTQVNQILKASEYLIAPYRNIYLQFPA